MKKNSFSVKFKKKTYSNLSYKLKKKLRTNDERYKMFEKL